MPRLFLTRSAQDSLDRIGSNAALDRDADRLDIALDELERDSNSPLVRSRRYSDPPMWGFVVRGRDENWLVLWGEHPRRADAVLIAYIGPDL